jgi:hypothetical protein
VNLVVGSLVRAKLPMGSLAQVGDLGICYEVYTLGDRQGVSIIFERGGHDGFSPVEQTAFLAVEGFSQPLSSYSFTNVMQLLEDFHRGIFAPAFETNECNQ